MRSTNAETSLDQSRNDRVPFQVTVVPASSPTAPNSTPWKIEIDDDDNDDDDEDEDEDSERTMDADESAIFYSPPSGRKVIDDPTVDSVKTVLVPVRDPVTKEIRNMLVPVEVRDESGLNIIKSVLIPFHGEDGLMSYEIKKVVVPIKPELSLPQKKTTKAKLLASKAKSKQVTCKKEEEKRNEDKQKERKKILENKVRKREGKERKQPEKRIEKETEKVPESEGESVLETNAAKEEVDQILDTLRNICPFCQKHFKDEDQMQKHVLKTHKKPYNCDKCHKGYFSDFALEEHQKTHEVVSFYQCSVCQMQYKTMTGLKHHQIREHSDIDPKFTCDYCGKRFKLKLDLGLHIDRSHMNVSHICRFCGMAVKNIVHHELKHEKTKKVSSLYRCSICPRKFKAWNSLENHLLMKHKAPKEGSDMLRTLCEKKFQSRSDFYQHVLSQVEAKQHKCVVCDKTFASEYNLRNHVTLHSQTYLCSQCGKNFTTKYSLKLHLRKHTGERPYQCKICLKTFARSASLRVHRLTHTGERPISTTTERSTAQNSTQQVVILCRTLTGQDQTTFNQQPFTYKVIPVSNPGVNNKVSTKIVRNCNKVNKQRMLWKGKDSLTNDSTRNGINVGLISNGKVLNNRVWLKEVNSNSPSNNNSIEQMDEDPNIDSVKQVLVPVRDPVTNESKNMLVPIEVTDDSGKNVIKSVLIPNRDKHGFISYDIKKVVVPINPVSRLYRQTESWRRRFENKVIPISDTVKKKSTRDEVIEHEQPTPSNTEVNQEEDTEKIPEQVTADENEVPRIEDKPEEAEEDHLDLKEEIIETIETQEEPGEDEVEETQTLKVSHPEILKEETDQILENLKTICPVCQKIFKNESSMQRHVRRFHEKTYPCDKCDKCYSSKPGLEEHKKSHEDGSYLQCSMCHMKYKRKAGLKNHQIRVHSTVDPKFMCDYCGKRFKLKIDLGVHIEKTHMNVSHICKICGKVVRNITHHEWQHERVSKKVVYRYRCNLCPKKFTTSNNLDNHLLMHKDGFKCKLCNKVFSSPFSLGSHKSSKHRPGATCTICERMFNNTSNFYQHVLTHAGVRPYKCDICGEDFTQRSSVLRHRKTHPGPLPPFTEPTPIADIARNILEKLSSV